MAEKPSSAETGPLVEFIKLIPDGRDPKRADRSGAGSLPGRAMRYCDALTTATGYGYWLFPPIDLQFLWDGDQVFWSYGNASAWLPLSNAPSGAAQFPGFSQRFDELAPESLRGYSPPFVSALPELGGVQVWTGLMARTRPGWALNVRMPVNLPGIPGLTAWEGIVESDHWFGPLFSNFRITKTDFPVRIRAHVPFLQVQPIPQLSYTEDLLKKFVVRGATDMGDADWEDLADVLLPNEAKQAAQGTYAVRIRKRRACPQHGEMLKGVLGETETG